MKSGRKISEVDTRGVGGREWENRFDQNTERERETDVCVCVLNSQTINCKCIQVS